MRKNKFIWLAVFLLVSSYAFSQQGPVDSLEIAKANVHYFSLQEALDYADKNNVQVKNALLDVKLQEQVNREVTGRAYPQINGSGTLTYNPAVATQRLPNFLAPAVIQTLSQLGVKDGEGNPIVFDPSRDWGYINAAFGSKWSSNGGLSLSQILFDGQIFTGLQARKTLIDFSNKKVEVTQEAIRTSITKIYYQLAVSKTQIDLLDSNIALVAKNIHDTKIMYDNGFAEGLEIDKLKVSIANLLSQRTKVINQISNGYMGLKYLMGMPVTDGLVLTDKITDENIKNDILENLSADYTKRKDYQLAQLGIKLGEYNIQRWKYSRYPQLFLSGYYNKMAQGDSFGNLFKTKWTDVSAINLGLQVPIFDGFQTRAKIQQEKIKLQQSHNQIDDLKNKIDNERLTAINDLRSAVTDLDYQKENMRLAEKVYSQTKKKYEVGTGTQIEIDAARVQLQTAQTNYYNALYNAIIARVDFLKATGNL